MIVCARAFVSCRRPSPQRADFLDLVSVRSMLEAGWSGAGVKNDEAYPIGFETSLFEKERV